MQLLIVQGDGEIDEELLQIVKGYRRHECDLVRRDAAAIEAATPHKEQNSGRSGRQIA